MNGSSQRARGLDWAGLAAGPTAWAVNTQLDYAVVPFTCGMRTLLVLPSTIIFMLIALAGAFLSWRFLHAGEIAMDWSKPAGGQPRLFLAIVGIASGVLFALVIANQAAATLLLDGCLR